MGTVTVFIYMILVPGLYYRKLKAASKPSVFLDGDKVCVGQELWSAGFAEKYSWFYSRYKAGSWHWEFVLMARKAALAALPIYFDHPVSAHSSPFKTGIFTPE